MCILSYLSDRSTLKSDVLSKYLHKYKFLIMVIFRVFICLLLVVATLPIFCALDGEGNTMLAFL